MKHIALYLLLLTTAFPACEHEDMFHAAGSGFVPVHVYSPASTYTGNLGGRLGADNLCRTNKPAQYVYTTHVRALMSVGPDDQLKDMADKYGIPKLAFITVPSGQFLAYSWYDLLDGNISNTLTALGVTAMNWRSGSAWDGSFLSACAGWTDGTAGSSGEIGSAGNTGFTWMQLGTSSCATNYSILCITW